MLGDVRAIVQWFHEGPRPEIRWQGAGLFGALAVQLTLTVAGVDGWAICSACHKQYVPTQRRPKAGQRNFCVECRNQGIPKQYALRDYWERRRQQSSNKE
jgi:hypothetical protein